MCAGVRLESGRIFLSHYSEFLEVIALEDERNGASHPKTESFHQIILTVMYPRYELAT